MLTVLLLIPASILWAKGTLFWKSSVFAMDPAALKLAEEQQYRDDLDRLLENRQFGALSSRLRLMFVGDSHSEDMAAALYLALGVEGYDYASLSLHVPCFSSVDRRPWIVQIADPQSDCRKEISLLKESRSLAEADYVFISNLWDEDTIGGFDEGIALIRSLTNARIVIVGQNAVFPTFDSSLRFLGTERLQKFNRVMFDEQSAIDVQINAQLEKLAATARLDFIDRQELECSAATASCTVVGSDGEFYYLDHNHWSYAGRKVYGEKLLTKYRGMLAQAHKLPPAVVGNRAGAL